MVDNHGRTISKNNLDELASITTIDDYYIGDNSMQVLNFKHNQHNSDHAGNYCFSDSNAKYFGINQLTTPNKFATIPHIYPEIVFNTTDGSDITNPEIDVATNSLTVAEKTYKLFPNDVVIKYIRKPGVVTNSTSASEFWNYTTSTVYKPNRSLINLELSSSFAEDGAISLLQLKPDGSTSTIDSSQPVYDQFLKTVIHTTGSSSMELFVRGVSDLIGSKASNKVFQFGKYGGYTEST